MSRITKAFYINYETGLIFNIKGWKKYYVKEIDHREYPNFECWMADMVRTNLLTEIHAKTIYEAKANEYAAERGIVDYSVKGKRMIYYAIQPEENLIFKITVDLRTLKEIKREQLTRCNKSINNIV